MSRVRLALLGVLAGSLPCAALYAQDANDANAADSADQAEVSGPVEESADDSPDEPGETTTADELDAKLEERSKEDKAKTRSERQDEVFYEAEAVVEAKPETQAEIEKSDVDIMEMDVAGSVDSAVSKEGFRRYFGDLRAAYNWQDRKSRDGSSDRDDNFTARFRFGADYNLREDFRLTGRLAVRCSTDTCDPGVDITGDDDEGTIENGTVTVDEFFAQWFRTEQFNIAVGRLQTRFVTRGGVFAKSLDRNNSNNTNITYTDGIQATINPGYGRGWLLHLISEYNDDDGATTTRFAPLDFDDSGAKISHFLSLENNKRWGYIVQRGFDITFLPDALLKDGTEDSKREDYWGFVGRTAARIPLGEGLQRLQLGAELGYAPETPVESALDIDLAGSDDDDTNGFAWNVSASLMDIYPGHSFGLLYSETQAGWLLSPQYGPNEQQIELRYSYRPESNLIIDARLRYRKDLDRLSGAERRAEDWQFFLRATVRYSLDNLNVFNLFD